MIDLTPYEDRDHLIKSIKKVRDVLIQLAASGPYDHDRGFALSNVSDIHKDLVQSLCMMDDTDRRNAAFNSEVESLTVMKKEFLSQMTEAIQAEVGSDKAEYVEEIVVSDEQK